MKTIKEGDKVKYIGIPNRWTYKQDLEMNSIGKVINISESNGKMNYQVEFENGITTSIDFGDLDLITQD
jgi:hypothetical protein